MLKKIWKKWLPVAHAVGNFQAQLLLTVIYFILFLPVGLLYRIFGSSLNLQAMKKRKSNFESWKYPEADLEQAKKPY